MSLKKRVFGLLLLSFAIVSFSSCSDDDEVVDQKWTLPKSEAGAYVLNSGQMGKNNSVLSFFDFETQNLTPNVFKLVNEKDLGDTAQDMLVYGSKMYVSMTGSSLVYVLDKNAKVLAEIKPTNSANEPLNPRSLVAHNGKVYVSLQGGYVGKIDTTSMTMTAKTKVGPYPEQMTVVDNKLYVATSSYIEHTSNVISIVDLNNFEAQATEKEVGLNPSNITSDILGNIYVVCLGDYGSIKSVVNKIDRSGKVTELTNATQIAVSGTKLYTVYTSYDASWNKNEAVLSSYDASTGVVTKESFVKLDEAQKQALSNTEGFAIDPVSKDFYFMTSDFATNGDIYIFSQSGNFSRKIDSGGLNPVKVCFLKQ